MNWNPALQELGKPTIKQEIIVRWISMSQLMESILSSYSSLTTIANEKGTFHSLPPIDISIVSSIVHFFAPWKHVFDKLQASKKPTIHLVVPSYWYILESLTMTKDEAADKTTRGISHHSTRHQANTWFFRHSFLQDPSSAAAASNVQLT